MVLLVAILFSKIIIVVVSVAAAAVASDRDKQIVMGNFLLVQL